MYINLVYFLILINLAFLTQPFHSKNVLKIVYHLTLKHEKSTVFFSYNSDTKFLFH